MTNVTPVPITLTTDFGTRDGYAGAMKGVILSIDPSADIIDITHEISPYAVDEAAQLLSSVTGYFPPGTIHVGVVDPGVGSRRKGIIIQALGQYFVGPDNGIFSGVISSGQPWRAIAITDPKFLLPAAGRTFQGRDVFAPVAAYLSLGVDLAEFGEGLSRLYEISLVRPRCDKNEIRGQVVKVDRFGNLITNISWEDVSRLSDRGCEVWAGGRRIGTVSGAYSEVKPGDALAAIGGFGWLEIAVNRGRAAETLAMRKGMEVLVRKGER